VHDSHAVSGTVAVNALGTHDAQYATPCHYRFKNHHHDCIDVHDAHYAADRQSRAVVCPQHQGRTTVSTANVKFQKSWAGKRYVGPTCGFTASPQLDPGATVDTLQTRYPRV
jgi:hypothetical protein